MAANLGKLLQHKGIPVLLVNVHTAGSNIQLGGFFLKFNLLDRKKMKEANKRCMSHVHDIKGNVT